MNMIVLTLVVISGVTALVIAAWKFGGASSTAKTHGPTAPLVTRRATPDLARLRVKAIKGSSVIDVRVLTKKGRLGRLLYHGTLERGESQSFAERSIWLSISTPRHIMLALNGGTPLALSGLCPRTIAVTPQQITQTVTCH
jgi:hypothetical protein